MGLELGDKSSETDIAWAGDSRDARSACPAPTLTAGLTRSHAHTPVQLHCAARGAPGLHSHTLFQYSCPSERVQVRLTDASSLFPETSPLKQGPRQ